MSGCVVHELKVWPEFWEPLRSGEKRFEVRRNDRGFRTGDIVVLQKTRFPPPLFDGSKAHGIPIRTGEEIHKRIGWILDGGQFGIERGYVVMQLEEM